jgi:acetyltransferase
LDGVGALLKALFCPSSVAVIGVGRREGNVGHDIFDNIRSSGYKGQFYPVNPKAKEIHGHACYVSILDIPEPVELAVVAVPSQAVAQVIEECGQKGVSVAIIISAGFRESGVEGAKLEKQVLENARKYGLRVLGPNCLGVIDTNCRLNASFAKTMPKTGSIAIMSQSGALLTSILDWARSEDIGFSKFISLGNKSDIDEIDLLNALVDDENTRVICSYTEGISKGQEFIRVSRRVSLRKPIVALKSGSTDAGARAVSSHTGSLAGSERAYNAAFEQAGVIRAYSVEDLFDYAIALAYQPIPKGRNIAILTNAGGPGIMATDACERLGIPLAALEKETIEQLRQNLPAAASVYNPIDILGDAKADRYRFALETILADANVHLLLTLLTPQAMTEIKETAIALIQVAAKFPDKPLYTCFMGRADIFEGVRLLSKHQIPNYYFPERAVRAIAAVQAYAEYRRKPPEEFVGFSAEKSRVRRIFAEAKKIGRTSLPDVISFDVVSAYGIKVVGCNMARDLTEAKTIAAKLGYPVVAKVASPDILHKSDVGGIVLDIKNNRELEIAYHQILDNVSRFIPQAAVWGICIQEMIKGAREVIIGVNRDPQFGHLVMFGLGGIYVEVLQDVSFRIVPVSKREAEKMVTEIRSYPLLKGMRGQKGVDISAIVETIQRISQLISDFPEIVEMDINPLMVKEEGCIAADVRITIGE